MVEQAVSTHLGVLELQFGQLNEILTERGDPARLEVHELLFGGVREALEALAAQLLAALCWPYFSVPSPSFVQCLVSILVVSQCPKPPVQQVLRPSAAQDGYCHGCC